MESKKEESPQNGASPKGEKYLADHDYPEHNPESLKNLHALWVKDSPQPLYSLSGIAHRLLTTGRIS